jgi:hypothetical protein
MPNQTLLFLKHADLSCSTFFLRQVLRYSTNIATSFLPAPVCSSNIRHCYKAPSAHLVRTTVKTHNRLLKTNASSTSFANPFMELQKFVAVPILSEDQAVFSPSEREVVQALTIFQGIKGRPKDVQFKGSFADGATIPDSELPEVMNTCTTFVYMYVCVYICM